MHHCSSSSAVSSCVASSSGGAAAAAGAAAASASSSSYSTIMMGGAAVSAASGLSYSTIMMGGAATHADRFSLRQRQSSPLSACDCCGQALVWGIFGIGLVLLLLDGVASPRVAEPVQPSSALSQVQQP